MSVIKNVFITGASRGLGREIACVLAEEGYAVGINYVSNDEAANSLLKEIESSGGRAALFKGDVSSFEVAANLLDEFIKTFGSIEVLVNNAGITRDTLMARMKEQDFDDVINVNLKSAFNCTRHAVPWMMKQRRGRIINMASVAGVIGNAGQANYSASKAGLIGMTKAVAREVAKRGITVNAVAPGFIETDMTAAMNPETLKAALAAVPAGRMGKPEEVAAVVAFLASESAGYITGQVIVIDGGMAT